MNNKEDKEDKKEKKSYKIRTLRCSDKTWDKLKNLRWKSMKSWERFLIDLTKDEKIKK